MFSPADVEQQLEHCRAVARLTAQWAQKPLAFVEVVAAVHDGHPGLDPVLPRHRDTLGDRPGLVLNGKQPPPLGKQGDGKDLEKPVDFAALLEAVNAIPGDFLIRFMTSHPKDAPQRLFECRATGIPSAIDPASS